MAAASLTVRAASSAETRELTGDALTLQKRVTELQQTVKQDQAQVAALTAKAGAAGPTGDDLDVAKAQLSLDQDELSDSMEDLARASGDHRGKIQQELTARQASMKKYDQQTAIGGDGETAVVSTGQYKTLAGQIAEWWAQRPRMLLIDQAQQLAIADAAALTAGHGGDKDLDALAHVPGHRGGTLARLVFRVRMYGHQPQLASQQWSPSINLLQPQTPVCQRVIPRLPAAGQFPHLTRRPKSPTLVSLRKITPEDRPWSRGLKVLRST